MAKKSVDLPQSSLSHKQTTCSTAVILESICLGLENFGCFWDGYVSDNGMWPWLAMHVVSLRAHSLGSLLNNPLSGWTSGLAGNNMWGCSHQPSASSIRGQSCPAAQSI